jgi:hypothetical protein
MDTDTYEPATLTTNISNLDVERWLEILDTKDEEWLTKTLYNNTSGQRSNEKVTAEYLVVDDDKLGIVKALGKKLTTYERGLTDNTLVLNNTRIIKYVKGSYVSRHADKQRAENYVMRIVILPPSNLVPYEGGLLRMYGDENHYVVYADCKEWTVTAIPYGMPHEIEEVTEGTRYALVSDVSIKGVNTYSIPPYRHFEPEELDD